jgi:ketosteroid isomerase-like protein
MRGDFWLAAWHDCRALDRPVENDTMHIRTRVFLTLTMVVCGLPALADDAAVRRQIEAQMAKFQQAFRRKDLAGMRAITTPDFTIKSMTGRVSTHKEADAALTLELRSLRSIPEWTLKIEKLVVKGDVATAIVSEHMVARIADSTGAEHADASFGRMRETWVRTSGGWRYKHAEQISSKAGPANMNFVPLGQADTRRPDYVAARKAIEQQYALYQQAVRRKDLRAAMATMTSDVTTVYPNGKTFDRRQMDASLGQMLISLRGIKQWTLKIVNLNARKTSADATVGERLVSSYVDGSGALHHQTLVDFYVDSWIRTSHGWRLRNTRVLRGEATVDGKRGDPFR